MIEIFSINIRKDIPGINARYLLEARLIDEAQGYHSTDFGPVLNWDKSFAVSGDKLKNLIEHFEGIISEVMQS